MSIELEVRNILKTVKQSSIVITTSFDEMNEEVLPKDQDKIEDDIKSADDIYDSVESQNFGYHKKSIRKICRSEHHLFRYFIDGSLRTYYVAEILESTGSFPLIFAEVASAALKRKDGGDLTPFRCKSKYYFIIPKDFCSDTLYNKLISQCSGEIKVVDSAEYDSKRKSDDLRARAGGKARHLMHELELEIADEVFNVMEKGNLVIIDGSIDNSKFIQAAKDKMIALTKSFSFKPKFTFNNRKYYSVVELIQDLNVGERTTVFKKRGINLILWYVRIFEKKSVLEPFQGVVKIEMPYFEDRYLTPVEINEIDNISGCLLSEVYVNTYPSSRWSSNIYPIAKTEEYMKSKMFSPLYIRGVIKWT